MNRFERFWLVEAVRLREQGEGGLPDQAAMRIARASPGQLSELIQIRALHLAEENGLTDSMQVWREREKWLVLLGGLAAVASGVGLAFAVLGTGQTPVNLLAATAGLLGLHVAMLMLWVLVMGVRPVAGGGLVGVLWRAAMRRLARRENARWLGQARMELLARSGVLRWWFACLTHLSWLALLCGVVVGMLLAFSFRQYDFVWQTTILSPEWFVRVATWMNWAPGMLGMSVPIAEDASGWLTQAGTLVHDRNAWARWLIVCVLSYGVLPRLMLYVLCAGWMRWRLARLELDLSLPAYQLLARRLRPEHDRIGVTDAAPATLLHPRRLDGRTKVVSDRSAMLVALEMRPDGHWPPPLPAEVIDGGCIDSRQERKQMRERLALQPPSRLLLACDPALSPDRGALAFLVELAGLVPSCRVWLVGAGQRDGEERLRHWQDGLINSGFSEQEIMTDDARALGWLERGDV